MSTDINHYTTALRSESDMMSAVARTADLSSPVAACPGWDLRELIVHTGVVHRWATLALQTGAAPGPDAVGEPGETENLAVWIADGAAALIDAINAVDPDSDTWHPFAFERKAWVWARRQTLETAMHRWDAQMASGLDASLDPAISSEGIQEYFEIGLPRVLRRDGVEPPSVSLHVHCTDVDGEWLIWSEGGTFRMLPVHDKGDAAIRGSAADIWLLLMGRVDRSALDIVGDAAAADAWLDLPGW